MYWRVRVSFSRRQSVITFDAIVNAPTAQQALIDAQSEHGFYMSDVMAVSVTAAKKDDPLYAASWSHLK